MDCSKKKTEDGQKLERWYLATMLALAVHQIDAAGNLLARVPYYKEKNHVDLVKTNKGPVESTS